MRGKILIALLVALVVLLFPMPVEINHNGVGEINQGNAKKITSPLNYGAVVCIKIIRADGTIEDVGCSGNVVTEAGLNHIKYLVGEGASSEAVKYLALGNGSAPTISSTYLDNEITNCGLARAEGTYTSNGVGNWTRSKTWTCTCDGVYVNTTALFNATSGGTMFAGYSFSTRILYENDQLQESWTIWISES